MIYYIFLFIICLLSYFYKSRKITSCEDHYQISINGKNNTNQSTIDAFFTYTNKMPSYDDIFDRLKKFNKSYNSLYKNKINSINVFTNKDFISCKNYHYKVYIYDHL